MVGCTYEGIGEEHQRRRETIQNVRIPTIQKVRIATIQNVLTRIKPYIRYRNGAGKGF